MVLPAKLAEAYGLKRPQEKMRCLGRHGSAERPGTQSDAGEGEVAIQLQTSVVPIAGKGGRRELQQPLADQVPYIVQRLRN